MNNLTHGAARASMPATIPAPAAALTTPAPGTADADPAIVSALVWAESTLAPAALRPSPRERLALRVIAALALCGAMACEGDAPPTPLNPTWAEPNAAAARRDVCEAIEWLPIMDQHTAADYELLECASLNLPDGGKL